jgi:hypothetical protein
MKCTLTLILLLFAFSMDAQDEYEKKEKPLPVEPTERKSDSIDISEKKKTEPEVKEDNSKAFKGMSDFKRNLRIGGAFNLGSFYYETAAFQGNLFFIMASPQLTYVMSEHFEGGLTTSYSYTGTFRRYQCAFNKRRTYTQSLSYTRGVFAGRRGRFL